jgi:polysaccharide export outer membrane protein
MIKVKTLQEITSKKWPFCFIVIFLPLFLLGCAQNPDQSALAAKDKDVPTHNYLIGPGDQLNIMVWHNPEISMSVPVRPDGKITTPLVEDLQASGKTSSQLARDIERALSRYIQSPIVTVIVTGFVGPYGEQIRVIGQAAKPQSLPYRDNMTLVDVLIMVGGLTPFADGNSASIIRSIGGKREQFRVLLNDLINKGDISANVAMKPGDILVIPESFF